EQYGVSSLIDDSATRHSVNRVDGRQTDAGYITLGIGSHKVQFECDTGSQCNILPLSDYKLATGDTNLQNLTRVTDTLTVYGGTKVKVMGITTLQVHRNGRKHNLHFKVMSGKHRQPLLSRQACVGVGALQWIDVDAIRPLEESPETPSVNNVDAKQATKMPSFDTADTQHQ
ncbi:hypothetical protein DJ031_00230, partial [bacterium endosymbiont of Escarpia laminata]